VAFSIKERLTKIVKIVENVTGTDRYPRQRKFYFIHLNKK